MKKPIVVKMAASTELRARLTTTFSVFVLIGILPTVCQAHKQKVHERISESAAVSSDGLKAFLSDFLGAEYDPSLTAPQLWIFGFPERNANATRSPIDWIATGSFGEDDSLSIRSSDHFYTVTPDPNRQPGLVPGLTDRAESLGLGYSGILNSFTWASQRDAKEPSPSGAVNIYGWPNAREYQYTALAAGTKTERQKYLAAMLCALGHVIHLNQDLAQPEHVRNDEHMPWHSFIEQYGYDSYLSQPGGFPTGSWSWPYWRGEGFSKLVDFWDRAKYLAGDASALDADEHENSGAKLGLAEFCNGNFLGEDALYGEFLSLGSPHYFPLPSLADTTQPNLKRGHFSDIAMDSITLENGKHGNRVYVGKLNAGIPVEHHSALHYLAVKHPPKSDLPDMVVGLTIHDDNVLKDYHSILIPKAIEYSAGILDYFFRGTMTITPIRLSSEGWVHLQVVNTSGQDFYGGTFELYGDASDGTRTPLPILTPPWAADERLTAGGTREFSFCESCPVPATITEYNSSGGVVRSLAGIGNTPNGLDVDANGSVYVAVTGDNQVRKFLPSGTTFVSDSTFGTGGRIGKADRTAGSGNGEFNQPYDVAVDSSVGEIAVSDSLNHRVQRLTLTGAFTEAFGTQGTGSGQYNTPKGLFYDSVGYLYVADSGNSRMVLNTSGEYAGSSGTGGSSLGQFQSPNNGACGSRGLYIADTDNNRVQFFEIFNGGEGVSPTPFICRGALSTELGLNHPRAVAADGGLTDEKVWIADTGNNRVLLARLPTDSPEAVWTAMKQQLLAGNIAGAISYFSGSTAQTYRQRFLLVAPSDLIAMVSQIPGVVPVFIDGDTAQYRFEQTLGGRALSFPIDFAKENGAWKIVEF